MCNKKEWWGVTREMALTAITQMQGVVKFMAENKCSAECLVHGDYDPIYFNYSELKELTKLSTKQQFWFEEMDYLYG